MNELALAFTLGIGSAASPCLLPLYPGFIAYLSGNSRAISGRRASGLLGLFVLAGVLTAMIGVAAILLVVAVPMGAVLGYLIPFIDALLVALGVLLLLGRNPFERLPGARVPLVTNPYGQAYAYGLMLGPLALPCAGPFVVSLLAISVGVVDAAGRLGTFAVYGLGFGLPLFLLSVLASARQQALVRFFVGHHRVIEVGAGGLLIAVGLLDAIANWPSILLTFGL